MLSRQQIDDVKGTWVSVEAISDTAAELFYRRLFELDPELRPLFKGNMEKQGKMLMQTIGVAVAHLEKLGEVVPAIEALGRRHAGYGVKDSHYDTVAQALLWTLEKGLGEAYTPAVAEAWTLTYAALAGVMKNAASESAK